jgi:SNF2 family DNA or RNA helicase
VIGVDTIRAFAKYAKATTTLQPHQQRVVERLKNQPGLVVAHGLGSGKTLSSIAAAEEYGGDIQVIAPAGLVANYEKEIAKHVGTSPDADYSIGSYAKAVREDGPVNTGMLIVDEAHRARDPSTKTHQKLLKAVAEKKLLMTATPVYNHPADVGPLINVAAGTKVLPGNRSEFAKEYIRDRAVKPSFLGWLRGVKPGVVQELKNTKALKAHLQRWVDYHENSKDDFPDRVDEVVDVPISKQHSKLLQGLMRDANPLFAYKVRKNLPPSKQESARLNAFLGAVRQASTSTAPYSTVLKETPKVDAAFDRLSQQLEQNDQHRAVIYSNYLDAGLEPYRKKLDEKGVPYAMFTGKVPKKVRDEAVRKYNRGELKALLVSSAGGEGLDLKGTRQIQILDPHWNEEKLKQVIGRGIRYKSHAHLPEDQRSVRVERFHAVDKDPNAFRKFFGAKRSTSPDEYLRGIAQRKDDLNKQVVDLMRRG